MPFENSWRRVCANCQDVDVFISVRPSVAATCLHGLAVHSRKTCDGAPGHSWRCQDGTCKATLGTSAIIDDAYGDAGRFPAG